MSPADRPALVKRPASHPAEPQPPSAVEDQPRGAVESHSPTTSNGMPSAGAGVVFAVRIPAELRTRYRVASARTGRHMQDMVTEALEQYISQLES